MAKGQVRRVAPLLSALILGVVACLAVNLLARRSNARAFVSSFPNLRAPAGRARATMQGFKEDFDEWRSSLTEEERALVTEQANGEFNKAFRKSDTYMKDLPDDKIKSFSTILGKFFDNEAEDYKKEIEKKTPDYDGLLKKAGDKKMDFSLKNRIYEHDRDADRRYNYAVMRIEQAEHRGELYPQSSPLIEKWWIQNNDTESHESALAIIEFMKVAAADKDATPEAKAFLQKGIDEGVPPMGDVWEVEVPAVLANQIHTFHVAWQNSLDSLNKTEAELEAWHEETGKDLKIQVIRFLIMNYNKARAEVEYDAMAMKAFFQSQRKADKTRTKADVLKEIWEVLGAEVEGGVPPIDEELLAELQDEPASVEGKPIHSWGVADKLYKSEAIDAFGGKYLLGVFETIEEARDAFEAWNAEYEKARASMKDDLEQWGKQEQARLAADPAPAERIKKVLEAARR